MLILFYKRQWCSKQLNCTEKLNIINCLWSPLRLSLILMYKSGDFCKYYKQLYFFLLWHDFLINVQQPYWVTLGFYRACYWKCFDFESQYHILNLSSHFLIFMPRELYTIYQLSKNVLLHSCVANKAWYTIYIVSTGFHNTLLFSFSQFILVDPIFHQVTLVLASDICKSVQVMHGQ